MNEIGIMGVQIGWTEDKADNLNRAMSLIEEGLKKYKKTDVLCLPEMYYANPTRKNKDTVGETMDSAFVQRFADCAKAHHVNIITGTFPLLKDGKLYNTCLCFDRQGSLIGEYSKTHLFDAFDRKESDLVEAGNEMGIVDFDFGRAGIAVCYELRFPEYLRTIALQGADVLFLPAAFYTPRHDHWDILTRSAALHNLIYVAAINQYNRFYFGRSCIIDPNGVAIATASDCEGVIYGCIDLDYQREMREKLPVYENRRPELYHI